TDAATSLSCPMMRPPPLSTLFPYTTLFRSLHDVGVHGAFLHVMTMPTPVHQYIGDTGGRYEAGHRRVRHPPADVVDEHRARVHGRRGDLRAHEIGRAHV